MKTAFDSAVSANISGLNHRNGGQYEMSIKQDTLICP